eukprot:jgi/Mesen1/5911/ME000030S05174
MAESLPLTLVIVLDVPHEQLGADTAENAAQWMLAFRHHMQLAKGLSGAPNVPGSNTTIGSSSSGSQAKGKPARASRARHKDEDGPALAAATWQPPGGTPHFWPALPHLRAKGLSGAPNVPGSNTTIGSSSSGSQAKGKPARASRARHKDEDGPALAAATWQPPGGFAMTWTESLRSASQDVVSHSNWDIVDCVNGLRIFKERTTYGRGKKDPQVLMAVGVMPASSERVFDTIMALGSSRLEWDYTMQRCQLVEHVDGHTDIIHKVLRKQLFACRARAQRDAALPQVVLYSSVEHARCPPCKGYTRASVLSGGYVITPLQQGRGVSSPSSSVMKHMMEVDWRGCARRRPQLSRAITMHVLHRIAALREMLAASNNFSAAPASVDEAPAMHAAAPEAAISEAPAAAAAELSRLQQLKPHLRITPPRPFGASPSHKTPRTPHHDPARPPPGLPAVIPGGTPRSPHTPEPRISGQLGYGFLESEGVDEYFDVAEDFRLSGSGSVGEMDGGGGGGGAAVGVASAEEALLQRQEVEGLPASSQHEREDGMMFSTAALVVRRLQGLARKKAARRESAGRAEEEVKALALLGSLEPGLGKSSWGNPEASIFFVRGHSYLVDKLKVPAGDPLAQLAAVDWFTSDRREDHVACRPGTIIQRKGGDKGPFCFVVNLQVPGASTYSLVLYYMLRRQLAEVPLLQMFVEGDNQLRNSRFKLIPNVAKGSWLVKQSVGKKACLVGEALHVAYFRGRNYLEVHLPRRH